MYPAAPNATTSGATLRKFFAHDMTTPAPQTSAISSPSYVPSPKFFCFSFDFPSTPSYIQAEIKQRHAAASPHGPKFSKDFLRRNPKQSRRLRTNAQ
jgi:hypothetical protein